MQLFLTLTELQLLADIVEQKRFALSRAISDGREPRLDSAKRQMQDLEEIFAKVLERHPVFTGDELFTIAEALAAIDRDLKGQIAANKDIRITQNLGQHRAELQRLQEKIAECCAMV